MRIGVDLDHTIYGFPEFFREFIPAMVARGHKVFCTSNHTKTQWFNRDRRILSDLGIDPDLIDPQYLPEKEVTGELKEIRQQHKAPVADLMDVVFDDHADLIQPKTKTPIFKVPGKLSADRKGKLK